MYCEKIRYCGKAGKIIRLITFVVAILLVTSFSSSVEADDSSTLLEEVISLKLGLNGYVVGEKLTAEQKKIAEKHPLQGKAYEGTWKFSDAELVIVVDEKTDRILAMYQQKNEADKVEFKEMVASLMDKFGTPTTIAHGKILYWAFNKHGAVSEDVFDAAKKIKQTADLGIIATVKLSAERDIAPDLKVKEEGAEKSKDVSENGDIYFIITSDPLVRQFMGTNQS